MQEETEEAETQFILKYNAAEVLKIQQAAEQTNKLKEAKQEQFKNLYVKQMQLETLMEQYQNGDFIKRKMQIKEQVKNDLGEIDEIEEEN